MKGTVSFGGGSGVGVTKGSSGFGLGTGMAGGLVLLLKPEISQTGTIEKDKRTPIFFYSTIPTLL